MCYYSLFSISIDTYIANLSEKRVSEMLTRIHNKSKSFFPIQIASWPVVIRHWFFFSLSLLVPYLLWLTHTVFVLIIWSLLLHLFTLLNGEKQKMMFHDNLFQFNLWTLFTHNTHWIMMMVATSNPVLHHFKLHLV